MLKISELAERSGVSVSAIKHYLREGLLGDGEAIVRTSRNMAYYPPEYVERVKLIRTLQADRFLPLKVIKEMLDADVMIDRALAAGESREFLSRAEVRRRYDLPGRMLDRLAELGVLTPTSRGYDADDVGIIATMASFRAGGYDESLGFTVYDTLRYREALEPLVEEEVRLLLDRLTGDVDPDRAAAIVAAGAQPLRELLGALHSKMLRAELRRVRSAAAGSDGGGRAGGGRRRPSARRSA